MPNDDDMDQQSTRPKDWPGFRGRSQEHEEATETGRAPSEQAEVTQAQRALEGSADQELPASVTEEPGGH